MKTISKGKMSQLLKIVSREREVLVPGIRGENVYFLPWQQGMEPQWRQNSFLPPKDLFFPQLDLLYRYRVAGDECGIEALPTAGTKRAVVGIRNCDLKSLALLDKVFLEGDYDDPLYRERREKTLLIALNCCEAGPACFCTSLDVDPQGGHGADLVLVPLEEAESFGLDARTPGGEILLGELEELCHDTNLKPAPFGQCTLQFSSEGIGEKADQMFEHPLWGDLSRRCLGCGVCTYVCPTCHCFDLQGQNRGETGIKYRCWDSCMFTDYTLMAGGHDPRPSRVERLRNRFLHKLRYYRERHGAFLCSGCGRCLVKCPVHLDLSYVAGRIKEAVIDDVC